MALALLEDCPQKGFVDEFNGPEPINDLEVGLILLFLEFVGI